MSEFQDHIHSAIGILEKQIKTLEKLGIRQGCLVQSTSNRGRSVQWHWSVNGKRTYVKSALKQIYAGEIERGQQVMRLRSKIVALKGVL